MKLKLASVRIRGFRAFASDVKIDFPTQLAIVYGRNGQGKTALFDAVEWLFCGDILRYVDYGSEWRRADEVHIRSIFRPDIPAEVVGMFRAFPDVNEYSLMRSENGLEWEAPLEFWGRRRRERGPNPLWAHMLGQGTMKQLAMARGQERFEVLAPFLRLDGHLQGIQKSERRLKELRKTRSELEGELSHLPLTEDRSALAGVREAGTKAQEELRTLGFNTPCEPSGSTSARDELELWKSWRSESARILSKHQAELFGEMEAISGRYPDAQPTVGTQVASEKAEDIHATVVLRRKELASISDRMSESTNSLARARRDLDFIEKAAQNALYLHVSHQEAVTNLGLLRETSAAAISRAEPIPQLQERLRRETTRLTELIRKRDRIQAFTVEVESTLKTVRDVDVRRIAAELVIQESQEWMEQHKPESDTWESKVSELGRKLTPLATESNRLVDHFNEISQARAALRKHATGTDCPLCGQEHGSNEALNEAIRAKGEQWDAYCRMLATEAEQLSIELANIRQAQREWTRRVQSVKESTLEVQGAENALQEQLNALRSMFVWDDACEAATRAGNWDVLRALMLDSISSLLSSAILEIEDVKATKSQLTQEVNRLLTARDEAQRAVEAGERRVHEYKAHIDDTLSEIRELASRYLGLPETIEATEEQLNLLIKRLQPIIMQLTDEHLGIQRTYKAAEHRLREAEMEWLRALREKERYVADLMSSLSAIAAAIESASRLLDQMDRQRYLEDSIASAAEGIREEQEMLANLRGELKRKANEAIGPLSKKIEAAFRYLSPSLLWKSVHPVVVLPNRRERANLVFRPVPKADAFGKGDRPRAAAHQANTTFIFSEGQLTLLGLCTFLAQASISENQFIGEGPALNTLLLDDPVQTLDVLRDDALICLLCDIARERQLVVSTSDLDFANHLVLASRPLWEESPGSCGVIHLEGMTEEGPRVRAVSPHDWVTNQRIFLPSFDTNGTKPAV